MNSELAQRCVLYCNPSFFLFIKQDQGVCPEALDQCTHLLFFQQQYLDAPLEFERIELENDKRYRFVHTIQSEPLLRIDISSHGVQNCLATGELRRKVDIDDWEIVQPFVFHSHLINITFENIEFPIQHYFRTYRRTDLMFSLDAAKQFCATKYTERLKKKMLEAFRKETSNWINSQFFNSSDIQTAHATMEESIEILTYDYINS